MPVITGGRVIEGGIVRRGQARASYDFTRQGGAIGNIALPPIIPNGSVAIGGYISVITPPVGAGASIAVTLESAGDLQAAAVISGAPWSTTGRKAITPQAVASSIGLTADRAVTINITGAPLTAGRFDVMVYFDMP